jgi:NhaA family Na+:H+ antiporter
MSVRVSRLLEFLRTEEASGALLLGSAVVALLWANSPLRDSYFQIWETQAGPIDLHHWVNDGLMALFFFVVGLEIRREITSGELRDRRKLALPILAALGGMIVPAGIYLIVNASQPTASGFGVPVATDIAFALGVLVLAASHAPTSVRSFLLTLAIVDDIGAVLLIAVFYSGGVHPTVIGVALGLLTPTVLADRLESSLHPWTSRFVLPVFAFANAGVVVDAAAIAAVVTSPVGLGIFFGLVIGKPLGVLIAVAVATRTRVARMPADVTPRLLAGVAALTGIGFTVSLFVADLAFDEPHIATAKLAVLCASVVAGVCGALILRSERRHR